MEVARHARLGWESDVKVNRGVSPNDRKLSDRRGWRDRCAVGGKAAAEAAGVTAAPVRCSAWLGVAVKVETPANWRPKGWLGNGKLPPVAVTCAQKRRATPGELRWVMNRLTNGLRTAKRVEVPGTDSRCVELGQERKMTP